MNKTSNICMYPYKTFQLLQNEQAAYTGHFIGNLCDIRDNPNVNRLHRLIDFICVY